MIPNRSSRALAPLLAAVLLAAPGPLLAQQGASPAAPATPKAGQSKPAPAQKPQGTAKPAAQDAKAAATAGKAQPKSDAKPAAGPGGGQATLLAKYGEWGAYATQAGKAKICYALSKPLDRTPKDLKRDDAYLFVSFRPGDSVKNEVAVMMGFPTKDGGSAEAVVGSTTYALITKDQNAWVKNPAEEAQVVSTMAKGQNLVIKAASKRGNQTSDRYSLNGFGPALERVRKECP